MTVLRSRTVLLLLRRSLEEARPAARIARGGFHRTLLMFRSVSTVSRPFRRRRTIVRKSRTVKRPRSRPRARCTVASPSALAARTWQLVPDRVAPRDRLVLRLEQGSGIQQGDGRAIALLGCAFETAGLTFQVGAQHADHFERSLGEERSPALPGIRDGIDLDRDDPAPAPHRAAYARGPAPLARDHRTAREAQGRGQVRGTRGESSKQDRLPDA